MKRLLAILFVLIMTVSVFTLSAFAYEPGEPIVNGWELTEWPNVWDCNNYRYYVDGDRSGIYLTDSIAVYLAPEFCEEHYVLNAYDFYPLASAISNIAYYRDDCFAYIFLDDNDSADAANPVYTDFDILDFTDMLGNFSNLFSFVESVHPGYVLPDGSFSYDDPIEERQKPPFVIPDSWKDYDSYVHYKEENHSEDGGLIDCALVDLTDRFCEKNEKIDASFFPEISDKIVKIEYWREMHSCGIYFDEPIPYTEQAIDDYLAALEYLGNLSFVEDVYPNYCIHVIPEPDPIDPDTTESDTTAPDTTAPETTAPETAATEQNKPTSDQTGDNLFFAVSVALIACTALTTGIVVKGRKKSAK